MPSTDLAFGKTLAPVCCPFCGTATALTGIMSRGYVEYGEYRYASYCWEGHLIGWECQGCGGRFFVEPTEAEVHEECLCITDSAEEGKDECHPAR